MRLQANGELRQSARYPLQVPALFDWNDALAGPQNSASFTRDLSTTGAFIYCKGLLDCPGLGVTINLRLILPPLAQKSHAMELQVTASVVRMNEEHEGFGFAAKFDTELGDSVVLTVH